MNEFTFSCRINGRAGYLRVWDDALELVRSGRRSGEPEFVPFDAVTHVATGKPGRLFTAVELDTAGGRLALTFPAADAARVAELIQALVAEARPPAPVPAPVSTIFAPPTLPEFEAPFEPTFEVALEAVEPQTPEFVVPDFSLPEVVMPEWTPLPDTDLPAGLEVVEPWDVEDVEDVEQSDDISGDPEESSADAGDLPAAVVRRLDRLVVLRNSGIMTDADFAAAEAEIFESMAAERKSA